jgi:ribosome recycling factor
MTIDEFIDDATRRMDKSVESAQHEFNTLRTGRASAALLDRIQIDYYGTKTPLNQLASINAPEPRLLTVQPFDPSVARSSSRLRGRWRRTDAWLSVTSAETSCTT